MSALKAALFLSVGAIAHPIAAHGDPVGAFVQRTFGTTTYKRADTDLNGDGRKETLVYLMDPDWCGSGGCSLVILSHRQDGYRVLLRSTITRLPIMLLATNSHGWRDIGVTIHGGGIMQAYEARFRFNGHRYPNTTMPLRHREGKVLISP